MANKESLEVLRSKLDKLKSLSSNPSICDSSNLQDRIIKDFLNDAVQLIEGAFLVGKAQLGTPLFVLIRILCELMFRINWISLSPENATQFQAEVKSEISKLLRANLGGGRAKIVDKVTGEDRTDAILQQFQNLQQPGKKIENLAKALGLSKAYDTIYRYSSLEVHMKTFETISSSKDDALSAGLDGIASLTQAIILITETKIHSNKPPKADEILKALGINIGGK